MSSATDLTKHENSLNVFCLGQPRNPDKIPSGQRQRFVELEYVEQKVTTVPLKWIFLQWVQNLSVNPVLPVVTVQGLFIFNPHL